MPVFAEDGGRLLGVITLAMAPEAGLFPLLSEEGVSTRTGETLLFRVDERGAAYLSPFRHPAGEGDAVDRSLEAIAALVKASAVTRDSFAEALDYRAVPVFAAIRRVAPTSWGLVFKVDRKEALAEFQHAGQLAGAAAAFLLLALAGLLISLWRQQQRASLLRAQMEQERAIFNLRGYAETIVASVPSGLLLLGADLRVLSVNRAFLDAFHLRRDDVLGRDLDLVVRADGLLPRARGAGHGRRPARRPLRSPPAQRQERRPVLITLTASAWPRRTRPPPADRRGPHRGGAPAGGAQGIRAALPRPGPGPRRDRVGGGRGHARVLVLVSGAETILGYATERWLREPDFFRARIHPDDRDASCDVPRGPRAAAGTTSSSTAR